MNFVVGHGSRHAPRYSGVSFISVTARERLHTFPGIFMPKFKRSVKI